VNLSLGLLKDALLFIEGTRIGDDLTFASALFDNEGDSVSRVLALARSIVTRCVIPSLKEMIGDPQNDLGEATQLMADIYFGFIPAFHGFERFVRALCSSHPEDREKSLAAAAKEMRGASDKALGALLQSPEHVLDFSASSSSEMSFTGSGPPERGERSAFPTREMTDLLYEVMDLSEENVLEILCAKVHSYSANYIMMDWCPNESDLALVDAAPAPAPAPAPGGGGGGGDSPAPAAAAAAALGPETYLKPRVKASECVREISGFIGKMSRDARRCMPAYLHRHLFSQVFQHASDHILQLLSCSAVSRFNLLSILQLKADIDYLKEVAVCTLEDGEVDYLFASLDQVLDYMLTCLPESILDPKVKHSLYPQVQNPTLGRLLLKYQELSSQKGSTSSSNLVPNPPTKQQVDAVAQKLLANL